MADKKENNALRRGAGLVSGQTPAVPPACGKKFQGIVAWIDEPKFRAFIGECLRNKPENGNGSPET